MRAMTVVLTLAAMVLISSAASGLSFFEPHPNVFVFINPPNPRQNDTVAIDMFTYLSGRSVDADVLPVIRLEQLRREKPVEGFSHVGLGHYRTHLDLSTLSASPFLLGRATTGSGFLTVMGNLSGTPFWRQLPLYYNHAGLFVRLSTNTTHPFPGDVVGVRAEVYNGSSLIEPDSLSVEVMLPTNPASSLDLLLDRQAPGVYHASFTYPPVAVDLSLAMGLRNPHMKAIATYEGTEFDTRANFQYTRYQVWLHRTPLIGGESLGVFWVADARGQPAAGVPVTLFQEGGNRLEVVTDSSGRVSGEVTFSEEDPPAGGRVGVGTAMENHFRPPIADSPYEGGITPLESRVLPDGTLRDHLRPNATITRNYLIEKVAFGQPREPVANAELSYYVWTRHSMVDVGRLTTNASGGVALSFEVPPENVLVGFTQDQIVQGMQYEASLGTAEYTVASPAMGLNASPLTLGGPTLLRALPARRIADFADQNAPYYHQSSMAMLPSSGGEVWERWSYAVGDMQTSGSGYGRVYHLPSFLPDDAKFLVEASLFTGSDRPSQFAVLSPGEGVEIPVGPDVAIPPAGPPPDPVPDYWPLALGLVVAAVAGVILFVVLWVRRKSPPGESGEEPGQ